MPSTRSYDKVGKTTYQASIEASHYDEIAGSTTITEQASYECEAKQSATAWLEVEMPRRQAKTTDSIRGDIREGVYNDTSGVWPGHGFANDAEWEETGLIAYADINVGDTLPRIEWEQI